MKNSNRPSLRSAAAQDVRASYGFRNPAAALAGQRTSVVKFWAAVGIAWLCLAAYVWGSWILSPEFKPTPVGADAPETWVVIWTHTLEAISVFLWLFCLYFFAYRPYKRTGRFSWDGLFVMAAATLYIQDPLLNYTTYWCAYSANFVNWGSWTTKFPGWMTPNGNLIPEAPLAWGGAYTWFIVFPTFAGCWGLRKIKEKYPQLGTVPLVISAYLFYIFLNLATEGSFVFTRLYAFPSTIPSLTLFYGKIYQFPIYESFVWGSMWTVFCFIRFMRDDKGMTFAERGHDKLKLSEGSKTFVRWLALVGLVQMTMLAFYCIPIQFFAMHGSDFPKNMPSYLMAGVCGEGTAYDCPGATTPIPKFHSPTNRIVLPATP